MLAHGMVVRRKGDTPTERAWVILNVTQEHLDAGIFTDHTGLHAFGGMWHGNDPLNIHSYGKLVVIDEGDYEVVASHVSDLPLDVLKRMV